MGKIKGWKKDELNGSILWRNPPNAISYRFSPKGIAEKPHILSFMKRGIIMDLKYFKTKAQAEKFAIQYMRTHPRG